MIISALLRTGLPRVLGCLFLLAVMPGLPARGDFMTSNLTASGGFNSSSGWNLTGPNTVNGQGFEVAVEFTTGLTVNASLTSVQLALAYRSGTNALNVSIVTDLLGKPNGTTLETISLTNISSTPTLTTFNSILHPTLVAGVNYWLVATYGGQNTSMGWYFNSTGQTGHTDYRSDTATTTGTWNSAPSSTDPAFAVSGTSAVAVDTPPSGILISIAGLGLAGGRWVGQRRGKRAANFA